MRNISIFSLLIMLSLIIISCDKNSEDTTKPIIDLVEPADDDTVFIGYGIHLEMELTDNVKLRSYKIDIHDDFDGHGHSKKSGSADVAWSFSKSWDVSGLKNTRVHHHEIMVPATINGSPIAKGKYHFTVYCTDEAGNESYVVRDVIVGTGVPSEED